MNTMEITKIVGGVCGSLLVFLLIKFGADAIMHGEAHEEEFAYAIEVEEGAAPEEEEEIVEVDFAEVYQAADPAAGERLFRACSACHKLEEGANAVGPHLYDIVGRDIAGVAGFSYSEALAGIDGSWDPETLSAFIEDPAGFAPGTAMGYRGMSDVEDRADLIAYLETIGG